MRRAAFALLLAASTLAGAVAATAIAGASPVALFTTGTTTTATTATVTTDTGTTSTTTSTTLPTTTLPPPTTTTVPTTTATTTARTTPRRKPARPRPALLIAEGVTIGGVRVGGLSPVAAYAIVRTAFLAPLVLRVPGGHLEVAPRKLGAVAYVRGAVTRARRARRGKSVELVVRVSGEKVRRYLDALAKRYDVTPVDSRLLLRGTRPYLTKDRAGRALDRKAATKAVLAAFQANERFPLEVPFQPIVPEVTRKGFGPVVVIRRGSNQLYLYDGMRFTRVFHVATGQARYPTPLGRFEVVVKWRYPWWYPPASDWAEGLEPVPPGPGNPLGTRWMGLSASGVGIHGTPDPASIGYSVSHGCIRMLISEAEWLFQHVEIGTPVFIVTS